MKLQNTIAIAIMAISLGCNQESSKTEQDVVYKQSQSENSPKKPEVIGKMQDSSFVISCGSGCALTYDAKQISGNQSVIKVNFSVIMFEDQEETDHYPENFIFYYDQNGKLIKINREGESESFLETQMPNAQSSFKDFATRLILHVQASQKLKNKGV